jgi:AcrR family transcriptional regulator
MKRNRSVLSSDEDHMAPTTRTDVDGATRPRVEGDRELEILDAALMVMADVGYDRLTMDQVATAARASKATLYRRWQDKSTLVIEALLARKGELPPPPDTGSLRGDLLEAFCGMGGLTDHTEMAILGAVATAIGRDEAFAERFRRDFIEPKAANGRVIFERAQARGEIGPDVELDLIVAALPGIVLHRAFLLGEQPTDALVSRVIDQIVLPAVTHCTHHAAPQGITTQEEVDRTS